MCRRITCNVCAKPSFAGCGLHVESVLGDIPRAERCHCRESAEMPGAQSAETARVVGESTRSSVGQTAGRLAGELTGELTGAFRRLLGFVRPDRRRRP